MSSFKIVCGSTVDVPFEFLKERDISSLCFHFDLDGKQYDDDFEKSISYEEFFKRISQGAMPTTSQINTQEHTVLFDNILMGGSDVLYIAFSSGLSGTCNSGFIAAEELSKKYPDRKILVVDSLAASSGYGLLVDSIASFRDSGATIEETHKFAEDVKLKLNHWFFSTDLSHYKRGGRISATSAFVGTLLGVCPLMNMDCNGKLVPRRKVRGKNNVIKEIVKEMENNAEDGLNYTKKCFISHSACYEDAKLVADLVEEKFPHLNGKVFINSIGTVVGAHTGPGTVALFFFGKNREN